MGTVTQKAGLVRTSGLWQILHAIHDVAIHAVAGWLFIAVPLGVFPYFTPPALFAFINSSPVWSIRKTFQAHLGSEHMPSPLLLDRLPAVFARPVNHFLKLDRMNVLYEAARSGQTLERGLLEKLDIRIQAASADLDKIPVTGPVVAVSNHPFGILDGVVLSDLVRRVRPDVRILTNPALACLPELASHCIFVDPFDRPECRLANGRALKQAIGHLRHGGMLLIFPAGEVAHFHWKTPGIRDPEWNPTAARLIRMTGAKALPIFVRGSNSLAFQMLGMVHSRLRTASLAGEFLNKRSSTVQVRIGSAIDLEKAGIGDDASAATRYLRLRCELLARRNDVNRIDDDARDTPALPVASANRTEAILREIEFLPPDCLLVEARGMSVFLAEARRIPCTLQEIGRLREVTFREAGEGTGQAIDLDRYDAHYLHLFLWNNAKRELVGAYRLGDVPRILARFGRKGLYTNSLFRFEPGFLENLGPAIELGRSFIRPECQRQFTPLLLLWQGIAAHVARRPEYSLFIGAVSVSNRYSKASRDLIVRYFATQSTQDGAVRPRRPQRGNPLDQWEIQGLCSVLSGVEGLSESVSDLEHDGKGLPILVKQYAKLGGKLLAFSVDPKFGNTLDGFVMLDLALTDPDWLVRYMGRERAGRFLAWHRAAKPLVA